MCRLERKYYNETVIKWLKLYMAFLTTSLRKQMAAAQQHTNTKENYGYCVSVNKNL